MTIEQNKCPDCGNMLFYRGHKLERCVWCKTVESPVSRVSVDTRTSRKEGNMVKKALRVETGYGLVEDGVRLQKSVRTRGPLVFDSEKKAERARSECRAGPDRFRVVKVRILYS